MKDPVTVPTLLLHEEKCKANIRFMAEKARRLGLQFRPHFKTHQSHTIGRWFRDHGVERITVSSLRMAEYFAADGWKDITVAFPVNIPEAGRINRLAAALRLNIIAESAEVLARLDGLLSAPVNCFIKADIGYHRTGVAPDDYPAIDEMLSVMSQSRHIRFAGFLGHAGHSYGARSRAEVEKIHYASKALITSLKDRYRQSFPGLMVSVGDTPTCSLMEDFSGVDEIRPGNFVFYDMAQSLIGSCEPSQVAVAMACPVVSVHPGRNELVIYGGSVHFSKDRSVTTDGKEHFGMVTEFTENGWESPSGSAWIKQLCQEHGIIKGDRAWIASKKPGDIMGVLPVHSCLTSDCMKSYLTTEGRWVERFYFTPEPAAVRI